MTSHGWSLEYPICETSYFLLQIVEKLVLQDLKVLKLILLN